MTQVRTNTMWRPISEMSDCFVFNGLILNGFLRSLCGGSSISSMAATMGEITGGREAL